MALKIERRRVGPLLNRSRQNALLESDTSHHPEPKGQGTLFIIRSVAIASWAIAWLTLRVPSSCQQHTTILYPKGYRLSATEIALGIRLDAPAEGCFSQFLENQD